MSFEQEILELTNHLREIEKKYELVIISYSVANDIQQALECLDCALREIKFSPTEDDGSDSLEKHQATESARVFL